MRLTRLAPGIILVAAGLALLLSGERNRTALLTPDGFKDHGQKFGISTNEPIQSASAHLLSNGWAYFDTKIGGYCTNRHYPPTVKLVIYFDRSWRKTILCLGAKNERVASIEWHAGPFAPEL
jgi:hypothetical protein